jgi:TRAP-type C4-dicarboxylate transport system permease small subunit
LVWNAVSPGARRIMKLLGNAIVGTLAAIAIPANWDYVQFMARESTPVLGLPFMAVFVPFVLLLASLVIRSAWSIWQALQGQGLDAGQVGEGRLS